MSSDQKLEDKIEKTRKEGLQSGGISFMVYLNVFKSKVESLEGQTLLNDRAIVSSLVKENFRK